MSPRRKANFVEEALWKQRFEKLAQEIADIEIRIKRGDFEISTNRAWDAQPEIFVSFCNDVVSEESKAIELFGRDQYDVYKLVRTGRDPYETEIPERKC